ncbi:MAG TPA: AraC family transcriptional regulator [Sphingomicrobium sp.]
MTAPDVRKVALSSQAAFDASVIYYAAGHAQDRHEHDRASFAILLAGSLVEVVEGQEHAAGPCQASLKPRKVVHADRYGPDGAVLLSFVFRCEETADEALGQTGWQWRNVRMASPMAVFDLRGAAAGGILDDTLWDTLAATERPAPSTRPPEWLRWAKSELDSGERRRDIASLAAAAGVHRVHFTRQFARQYGLAPSSYRQRQMAGRALRAMVDLQASPAAAAFDAGFADQSHMTRAIRRTFGATPGRLAALLAT